MSNTLRAPHPGTFEAFTGSLPAPGGVGAVDTTTFLAVVHPLDTYDSFDEMFELLAADTGEAARIAELAGVYERNGSFNRPVRVRAIHTTKGLRYEIENGCHRLCALVLLNAPSIPVVVLGADDEDPYYPESNFECEITFRVSSLDTRYPNFEEVMFTAMTAACSLEVDGVWYECDGGGSQNNVVNLAPDCPLSVAPRFAAVAVERLASLGIVAYDVTWHPYEW